ncbi:MAG TPA: MBL fold metallo-hydrolase [Chloroflexi bacterium]|jgi:L-ascorbate 6-phosphate lactonase|nr:MBL fold metallo-hydrolase [Chloroflexota bacterium]
MKTHQELLDEIARTQPGAGELTFWWLGQLSYVVKAGGRTLYFDPYLAPSPRRNTPPLLTPDEVTNADWVFGSHDHGDHIDPATIPGIAAASPNARFVCSRVARQKMLSLGVPDERIVALDDGLSYEEDGLRISAIAALHEFFDRDEELGYPYLSFIVETGGVTIYHSGDTLVYDGMLAKLSKWSFDVMFLPINGRDAERFARNIQGNMTFQEAVDMVGTLKPRLAVPGHYDMFTGNLANPKDFTRYMDVKYPDVSYWVGGHGEAVTLPPR